MLLATLRQFYLRSPDTEGGAAAPSPHADAAAVAAEAPNAPDAQAAPDTAVEAKPDAAIEPAGGKSLLEEAAERAATEKKPDEAGAEAAADAEKKPAEEAKPGEEAAKADAKTEAKPDGEAEAKPEPEPHKPFEFQEFTAPEGVTLDQEKVKEFTGILDDPNLNPQERGQKLVDLYSSEMTKFSDAMLQHQQDVWRGIIDGWKEEFRKDPEIGGARMETTLLTASHLVSQFLNEEEKAEYMNKMSVSGIGNYRLHLKLLAGIGKALNVFEDGITVPASQKAGGKREFGAGWYGGNGSAQ